MFSSHVNQLGSVACEARAEVFLVVADVGAVPAQVSLGVAALMSKAWGGFRRIALQSCCVRVFGSVLSPQPRQWEGAVGRSIVHDGTPTGRGSCVLGAQISRGSGHTRRWPLGRAHD